MITALCGGVGGSKLALGLYRVLPPDTLSVVVNTADDLEFCGLHVSPDLDTLTYTLAGLSRQDVGWGLEGDTFGALEMLKRFGAAAWFQVGDRDLATHVYRTHALQEGLTLTQVSAHIAASLGVRATILPMSDGRVATHLLVGNSWLEFQEYFVRRRHSDPVSAIEYHGLESAQPAPGVLEAIDRAEVIVLVNSNPILSLWPILHLRGVSAALAASPAARIAVSPVVGNDAVSGPAGRLMSLVGLPPTAFGVARIYRDVIDGIVIDARDGDQAREIEALGVRVHCTDILMRDVADRERLASETLTFARSLR